MESPEILKSSTHGYFLGLRSVPLTKIRCWHGALARVRIRRSRRKASPSPQVVARAHHLVERGG
jgi:hypothetical protein